MDSISVSEVDGGTLISAGEDNSLFVRNASPKEFLGSIKINGEPVGGNGELNLQSVLTNAASGNSFAAITAALDAAAEQGGAGTETLDVVSDGFQEADEDEAQVDEIAVAQPPF